MTSSSDTFSRWEAAYQAVAPDRAPRAQTVIFSPGWVPGEVIADHYAIPIPPDTAPGDYTVEIGMYDAASPTFQRLQVLDDNGNAVTDHILLSTITVK